MFVILIYHPALTPLVFSAHRICQSLCFSTFLGHNAPYDNMNRETFQQSCCTLVSLVIFAKQSFSNRHTCLCRYYNAGLKHKDASAAESVNHHSMLQSTTTQLYCMPPTGITTPWHAIQTLWLQCQWPQCSWYTGSLPGAIRLRKKLNNSTPCMFELIQESFALALVVQQHAGSSASNEEVGT